MHKKLKKYKNIIIGEFMNEMIKFNLNNVDVQLINTTKYKTVTGIISFVRPLNKEDFTYYSLLNRLIGSSSMKYKTKKDISFKMYDLYDCSVYMTTNYSYKVANSIFVFQTVNGKIVKDNDLVKKCVDLLKDIIFNPLIDNDGFNEKNFIEEKRALENDIKKVYNNKRKYAFRKLVEAMEPNSIISESTLGNIDILNELTPKKLYDFYLDVLNNSTVNMGVIGDISKEEVIDLFNDFKLQSKNFEFEFFPALNGFRDKVLEVSEKQDIMQAKLMLGFRFDIDFNSKQYIPLILFNAMFGGMFGSTLFMEVRERQSLAYDISSEILLGKKILIVSGGVDSKNCDITSDIIIKELEKYKQGIIDENVLSIAKEFIINDLKELQDSQFASLSYKLENSINNRPSPEEIIDKIKVVTIDDIKLVSNMIELDTIFTLKPGEEHE